MKTSKINETTDENTEPTKVIFRRRKGKDGSIIALFPEIPEDVTSSYCLSYEHIGQHGGANYDTVLRDSKPVSETDPDVQELIGEISERGYNLIVYRRATRQMEYARRAEFRRLAEELAQTA